MVTTGEAARRAQLKAITEAYFQGIASKDMSQVPYDDNVVLRSPLGLGPRRALKGGRE